VSALAYSFRDSKNFALFNIGTILFLPYSFTDSKIFALFNLGTLNVLAYYFRVSKIFALFNLETNYPGVYFRGSNGFSLLI